MIIGHRTGRPWCIHFYCALCSRLLQPPRLWSGKVLSAIYILPFNCFYASNVRTRKHLKLMVKFAVFPCFCLWFRFAELNCDVQNCVGTNFLTCSQEELCLHNYFISVNQVLSESMYIICTLESKEWRCMLLLCWGWNVCPTVYWPTHFQNVFIYALLYTQNHHTYCQSFRSIYDFWGYWLTKVIKCGSFFQ